MRTLADIPTRRLLIECEPCRRRGVYAVEGLAARFGEVCPLATVLNGMRGACGQSPCLAFLAVPMPLALDRVGFERNTFTIDSWTDRNALEMPIGSVYGYDVAKAAFGAAVTLWPHSIITVRLGAQIMKAYRPGEANAQAAQALILRRIGLR